MIRHGWLILAAAILIHGTIFGNGGPFLVKHPSGDTAAKGVPAKLDPSLKPQRETRLRVLKEDLTVAFGDPTGVNMRHRTLQNMGGGVVGIGIGLKGGDHLEECPFVDVTAAYTIENPTSQEIVVDFGFPILRGIYMNTHFMTPQPMVSVMLDDTSLDTTVLSNSAILGVIRARSRQAIVKSIAGDADLARLFAGAQTDDGIALVDYLTRQKKWAPRDAALLTAYARLERGIPRQEVSISMPDGKDRREWVQMCERADLGVLASIGDRKATQFLARLAKCFGSDAAAEYDDIFKAWGGDVREQSVDITTGKIRPREQSAAAAIEDEATVYARIDYMDQETKLSPEQKKALESVLKNLEVTFTFAPMNLLHYRATFPPGKTAVLSVSYLQYAFADTKTPASWQVAYVVHPATLWDHFGPIHLTVVLWEGMKLQASVPCTMDAEGSRKSKSNPLGVAYYRGELPQKDGRIVLAINQAAWSKVLKRWETSSELRRQLSRHYVRMSVPATQAASQGEKQK